jgi:Tol biopolymer transport system component
MAIAARRILALMPIFAIAFTIAIWLSPNVTIAAYPGGNGRIAYAGQPGGELDVDIFTILPDGSGLRQLTDDPAFDSDPSWSANGRQLVFSHGPIGARSFQIFTINSDGGDLTRVVDTGRPNAPGPSFSPSGGRIVYSTGRSIRTIRADGTKARRVLKVKGERGGYLAEPQYSPSGRRIAFAGRPDVEKRAGIWSVRRDGSRLRRLTDPEKIDSVDTNPDYSPDGRRIAFVRSPAERVCCNQIQVMRADGSGEHPIPGAAPAISPAWAPAGDRIALSIGSGSSLGPSCDDVFTMSPTGSDRQRVTQECEPPGFGDANTPSWQPLPDPP